MNALKSYSSDEDSDTCSRHSRQVKDGDPGTNYDSVGMDISEDSDEEKGATSASTKVVDSSKSLPAKNTESSYSRTTAEKTFPSRGSRDNNRESSSGSSRDSRESREHSSRDARRRGDGDRAGDRRIREDDRHDYDRRHTDHRRYRRDRSHERRSDRSRSRERRRSSRSRSRDRRNRNDVRRVAQQKLAAIRAADPDFDQTVLLKQSMVEQIAEVEKQTGLTLPTYYNPATMNPLKLAEQERKKRLLWGNKNKTAVEENIPVRPLASVSSGTCDTQGAIWANTRFNNDSDGKMALKFKRLMGVKAGVSGAAGEASKVDSDALKKQESLFVTMEKQYETARMVTHTNKGFGLGFSSQPFIPKQ